MEIENTELKDQSITPSCIIIIGSGPGGCAAAITCAQAGLNTVLVTNKNSGEKPTGSKIISPPLESIHPGVESLLIQLHAAETIPVASRAIYEGIQTGDHYVPLGADEKGNWQGHHINRDIFDAQLLDHAKKQGVTVIRNETVSELIEENNWVVGIKTASGKTIHSAYVIDASGHKRIAGKKLRFREKFFSPSLVAWTGVAEGLDANDTLFKKPVTHFIPCRDGWTWLAPEPPHRCTWTRLAVKGKQDLLPPVELSHYALAEKIKTSNRRWRIFRPLSKEGVILCGDAAGILDPAAGQGVLNAIWSGIKAAQCVVSCLHQPDYETVYLAQYDDWFMRQYEQKAEQLKSYYRAHGVNILV